MSRAGFPLESLSPPQTYDTIQGIRRNSPVLLGNNQTGTGLSESNSPTNQGSFPHSMNAKGTPQGRQYSPGGMPNGPSNGLPSQPSFLNNPQSKLMDSVHSRSASLTPPQSSSMASQPSRPGSAPPPASGPQLSSPMYSPSHAFGVHSSPPTPSSHMPPSNMTGAHTQVQHAGQRMPSPSEPLTHSIQPPNSSPISGAPPQTFGAASNIRSPRPSPWQAPMAGRQSGSSSGGNPGLAAPPTGLAGSQTHMTGPPTSLAGSQTRMRTPPTSLTGPPTHMTRQPSGYTGPPTSSARPPSSLTQPPTSLTGMPTGFTGPPTSSLRPSTSLTGLPSSGSTTPTGQMMGSTGQPLMPPVSQSPSASQGPPTPSSQTGSVPGTKRRVYPTQSYDNAYPPQGYPGTPSPTQPSRGYGATTPSGGYGTTHMGTLAQGPGVMPNMTGRNSTSFMNNQYGSHQTNQLQGQMGKLSVQHSESQPVNLLDGRNMLPPQNDDINVSLPPDLQKKNAKPSILACTLSNVPESHSLLQKCKLPFGILVHPFKDLSNLAVIQSSTIVRCRSCRTYINPFVTFTESRRWRCNMCYRINEVPEEFCYDPTTKSYGEPARRPEVKSATYEFIAPSEYMLRAPQPAAYVFAFDVSHNAIETGYLKMACELIKENLDKMPGDSRTLIGFLTFNKSVNFYNLRNDQSQPHMLIVSDIDDIFLPAPEDLLVNLKENKEMITQFLDSLPETFASTRDIHSATGAAMQAALKLMTPTGGRMTIFQTTLPSIGPGALENREEHGVKSNPKDAAKLNPSTDFYKKLALDCAAEQVAVDVFQLSSQYADCSSLMCASKYSGGCFSYFPSFHISKNRAIVEKFENDLVRYLTRKIGFEAVMRVRCTKGLSIHTFHGNFFVRSTDLLSLPNVNPDSAFGMQISIEDNLTDVTLACFQSALLYTSSRGERRIRVHNIALPVTKKMSDVYAGANADAIALMLSKMAVDRTLTASLGDAREALMNSIVDCLGVYKSVVSGHAGQLIAPNSLKYLPLYIISLLKQTPFRLGSTASLDFRCYAMQQFKVMPFDVALLTIYPALYSIHDMTDEGSITTKSGSVPQPQRLILSGEKLSRVGIFLMDAGQEFYIWVGKEASNADIQCLFGVANFESIPEDMGALPSLDNSLSTRVRALLDYLQSERTNHANLYILRDNSKMRMMFINKLMNDRTESMMSYHEFLIHVKGQIN